MTKIKINIKMDENFNIVLLNEKTKKQIEIKFSSKEINAYNLYKLFDYKNGNNYEITSNADKIVEGNERDYFIEVINLIDSIRKEINELSDDEENTEEEIQNNTNELFPDLN